jgi:hypothetical protein
MIEEAGLVAHYSKEKHLDKILDDGKILIGPVCGLDDPRESDMGWVDTEGIGHNFDADNWKSANKLRENLGRQLRLFCTAMPRQAALGACLTETSIYGRPRMWSQYGDKFKGFCVIFDQARLHQAIKSALDPTDLVIDGPIDYYDWLHMVNSGSTIQFGDSLRPNENEIFSIINDNNMLHSVYFKKGADWSEEIEYRWLVFSANPEQGLLVDIRDAIHSVVLGSRFPAEKYEEVKGYCRNLKCSCYALSYSHPKYDLRKI